MSEALVTRPGIHAVPGRPIGNADVNTNFG